MSPKRFGDLLAWREKGDEMPRRKRISAQDGLPRGLTNDLYIAHKTKAVGSRPGHNKFAPVDYLMEKKISYIVSQPALTDGAGSPSSEDRQFWAGQRPPYHWKTVRIPELNPPYFSFWVREGL